jgi:hypothetical protein
VRPARMYRVISQTGPGFKAHDRHFQSMAALGSSGLYLRREMDTTHSI